MPESRPPRPRSSDSPPPRKATPVAMAARDAELMQWLAFDPEPEPIPCDDMARAQLARLSIEISADEEVLLARYLGMLFSINEKLNLTRIDRESAWSKHVVDSLTLLAPLASIEGVTTAIDIGSGGGLPAIPLAIARREISWTLLEATGKKARFLEAVSRRLGLDNISVLNMRAEVAAHGPLREHFNVSTSRAVGPLDGLARISIPFLKIGGMMLAIKGERAGEEVISSKQPLYELHAQVIGELKGETNTILVVEKTRRTPTKFP